MKTIGLLGGMSWESTIPYYRIINERVRERLGSLHSARLVLHSVDFQPIADMQAAGDWAAAGEILARAALDLQHAGADFLVLCTNTMHKVAASIESATRIPLLHIAEPTGAAIRAEGLSTVALLGTRFTMEQAFYRSHLQSRFDLDVLVPDETDRAIVHGVIYDELCQGRIETRSRHAYQGIVGRLRDRGAQAVILGCTEIALLLGPQDVSIPVFDTAALHARAAADLALAG